MKAVQEVETSPFLKKRSLPEDFLLDWEVLKEPFRAKFSSDTYSLDAFVLAEQVVSRAENLSVNLLEKLYKDFGFSKRHIFSNARLQLQASGFIAPAKTYTTKDDRWWVNPFVLEKWAKEQADRERPPVVEPLSRFLLLAGEPASNRLLLTQ